MSAEMQHLLLTRFNVHAFPRRGLPTLEWLQHRLRLFERFCFPSIEKQTEQRFTWLIFVHPDTDRPVIRRLVRLQQRRFFEIVATERCDQAFLSSAACSYVNNGECLISTRFDNDDALHSDYIRRVQLHFQGGTGLRWLNVDRGLKLDRKGLYASRHSSNAFLSRIERAPQIITALTSLHSDIRKTEKVEHLDDFRGWLQVVHGSNVANEIGDATPCPSLDSAMSHLDGFCPEVRDLVYEIYRKKRRR
jgi:hypothetical protein